MKKIKLHPKVEEILKELRQLRKVKKSRFSGMTTKEILDYCRTH